MIAADLFLPFSLRADVARPEMDPLTESDALQEAALVDFRWNAPQAAVGLLFDLRGAIQLRMGTTGILIARGAESLEWSRSHTRPGPIWYSVVGSTPVVKGHKLLLTIALAPDAQLGLQFESAEFFVGDVPGMDAPPPDFTEAGPAEVQAGMPGWESIFEPHHATFLEPPPSD